MAGTAQNPNDARQGPAMKPSGDGPAGPGRGPARRRGLVLGMVLSLASLAVALLLAEGSVRLLRIQGDNPARRDALLGWSQAPGMDGMYVSSLARAPFHINRLGLVGPERSETKPSGTKRLLVLGDSFAEAFQVPYRASFCALLEDGLKGGWEVLNAGVSGYGTDQSLLYLQRRGLVLDPDCVVLLMFTGNDISDNDRALNLRIGETVTKPHYVLQDDSLVLHPAPAARTTDSRGLTAWIKLHSRLYLLARERFHRIRQLRRQQSRPDASSREEIPLTWHVYRRTPSEDWQRAWTVTAALLRELKKTTDARGIPLGVAILPTGWRIDPQQNRDFLGRHPSMADTTAWDFSGPDRRLGKILGQAGIPHLQLAPILEAAAAEPGMPLYADHLTVRGHQVVAQALRAFVAALSEPGDGGS